MKAEPIEYKLNHIVGCPDEPVWEVRYSILRMLPAKRPPVQGRLGPSLPSQPRGNGPCSKSILIATPDDWKTPHYKFYT